MPKRFSDKEKDFIHKRLKEEAMKCILTFGIKKTTVDELVKRVNIPKGTFYLFYESKEHLLFDAIDDLLHKEVMKKLMNNISIKGDLTVDSLTDCLFNIYQEFDQLGLLSILLSGDLELLIRKLPDDKVIEHLAEDKLNMEQFFKFLPYKENMNIEVFSGAFRGVFMTFLYKREIGEEIFADALRLLLRGIVMQILE